MSQYKAAEGAHRTRASGSGRALITDTIDIIDKHQCERPEGGHHPRGAVAAPSGAATAHGVRGRHLRSRGGDQHHRPRR